jgi:hypothetical protein
MSNKLTESLVTGQAPRRPLSFKQSRAATLSPPVNMSATQVFVGNSTGVLLNGTVGSQLIISATDPVFAVVSSGTANVSFIDAC